MDDLGACLDRLDSTCVVVTSDDDGEPVGCFVTFVVSASIDPRRIIVLTSHENLTHEVIERSGRLAVNLVPASGREWLHHWGYQSGREVDKFSDVSWYRGRNGCPILADAVGYIEGDVIDSWNAGDHTIRLVSPTHSKLLDPSKATLSTMDALAKGWEDPNVMPPPPR